MRANLFAFTVQRRKRGYPCDAQRSARGTSSYSWQTVETEENAVGIVIFSTLPRLTNPNLETLALQMCLSSRSRISPVALCSSGRRYFVLCPCFVEKWNRRWFFGERRIRRTAKETCKDPFLILPSSQPSSPCVSHGRNLRMEYVKK